MYYYTYAYLREDKTPYYIGKGKGNRAYRRRKTDIKPPKDKSRILILKQNLTEQEAFRHEVYMIDVFGRKDLGTGILYNKTDGGDGVSGYVHTEETKRKLSKSKSGENHYMYGKILSVETKKKISKSNSGKNHPLYGKFEDANPNYGKTHSTETKNKMSIALSGENHPLYGKMHSTETKNKISDAMRGRIWITNGTKSYTINKNEILPEGYVKGRKLKS